MKTFIFSYIVSFGLLVAAWYPDVVARPFHVLPRLAFYMAFPMAVILGMILIALGSILGIAKADKYTRNLSSYKPADVQHFKKSA